MDDDFADDFSIGTILRISKSVTNVNEVKRVRVKNNNVQFSSRLGDTGMSSRMTISLNDDESWESTMNLPQNPVKVLG